MLAYVSGEAARGVLLQAGSYHGFELDSDACIILLKAQIPAFFQHAWDVEQIECASVVALKEAIERYWKCDRAMRLLSIAFQNSYDKALRVEAAECIEDFISDEHCKSFVLNHIYSNVLPDGVDAQNISEILDTDETRQLSNIFDDLVARQEAIQNCISAWDQLPDNIFRDEDDRLAVRTRIVNTGAFYKFASSSSGSNDALFRILADPVLSANAAKTREIFELWGTRYKELPAPRILDIRVDEGEVGNDENYRRERRVNALVAFQRVRLQKTKIKEELITGDLRRADDLIEGLIRTQRQEGAPEHLAKSLCDLAIFARELGDVDRCLTLTLRATTEAPTDSWAYGQLGYAYLSRNEFASAMEAFETAEKYGAVRSAKLGRAETLKYLGQKELALKLLDECMEEFPNDAVSKNSRASLYAYFGLFEEALEIYNHLSESPFADAHVYGGRGSVLFDLGKYDDAIVDQDLAISLSEKGDVIAHCAKADMLRILGRFDDALSTLGLARRAATTRLPLDMVRSRVFRDRGNFDASRGVLEDLGKVYPKDVGSRIALAELDRKEGLFDTALEKFLILEKNEAGGRPSRNSMAATFGALGEYEKAISYLPIRSTSTRSDWVAQHIRAMITMKSGDYTTAAALLTEGLESCPWAQERPYFASALATLRLKLRDVPAALEALESVSGLVTAGTAAMIAALRVHASLIDNAQARARELLLDIPEVGNSPLVARYISALREACFERHVDDRGVSDAEWSMFMGMAA